MSYIIKLLLIGVGGAIGTLFRYFLFELIPIESMWITLLCNVIGAFFLALLYSYSAIKVNHALFEKLKLLLGVGLLGGFTTFSTISLDVHHLLISEKATIIIFALYMLGTFAGGFLASVAGHQLTIKLAKGEQ